MAGWKAPAVWEGTYHSAILENYYGKQKITVGLMGFAIGRYIEHYLGECLTSANRHFMTGYKVLFSHHGGRCLRLPLVELGPLRSFRLFEIQPEKRVVTHIQHEVNFLFCMHMDQVFQDTWGGDAGPVGGSATGLVVQGNPDKFTYEGQKEDFYYHVGIFGRTSLQVINITQECFEGVL